MTNKTGLVELIQTAIETYRNNAAIGAQLDFRELAVSLVPDSYDTEEPSKGQGWE
jgi:hypothetical protein